MATMSATAMAMCTRCSAAIPNGTQLSVSSTSQQRRIPSIQILRAHGRVEIKAKIGLVRAIRSRSEENGVLGLGPSVSSAFFGTRPTRFYGSDGLTTPRSLIMKKSSPSSKGLVAQAGKNGIEAPERVLAALGYVLPFFDGIQYGRFFFLQYPVAESLLRPLYPLLAAYKGFPYSNFIAFFSLYLLVVRNPSISRYVRFNAMQAVVLDVLLILPTLVERTFAPRGGVGFELLIIFYNTVFLFLVGCFLFGVVSCILGKTPRLPIVADAADAQV
ncbi:unnamed protein product [Calypogeia fissa]